MEKVKFEPYMGFKYDNNVEEVIKIHSLLEKSKDVIVDKSTESLLAKYPGKAAFKRDFFLSKNPRGLKWCPTKSPDKIAKIQYKSFEWWKEQLSDVTKVEKVMNIGDNFLDSQVSEILYAVHGLK